MFTKSIDAWLLEQQDTFCQDACVQHLLNPPFTDFADGSDEFLLPDQVTGASDSKLFKPRSSHVLTLTQVPQPFTILAISRLDNLLEPFQNQPAVELTRHSFTKVSRHGRPKQF